MKTYDFLCVLASGPQVNGIFGLKNGDFQKRLQNGAIRKRRIIVSMWTEKTETFESDEITALVVLASHACSIDW